MPKFSFLNKQKNFFLLIFLGFSLVGCSDTKANWYDPYINKVSSIFSDWETYKSDYKKLLNDYFNELDKNFVNWYFFDNINNIKPDFIFDSDKDGKKKFDNTKVSIKYSFSKTKNKPKKGDDVIIEGYLFDPTVKKDNDDTLKDFVIPIEFTFDDAMKITSINAPKTEVFKDKIPYYSFYWSNIESFFSKYINKKTNFIFDDSNFSKDEKNKFDQLTKQFKDDLNKQNIKIRDFIFSSADDSTKLQKNQPDCVNSIILSYVEVDNDVYKISINFNDQDDFYITDDIDFLKPEIRFAKISKN